MKEKWSFFERYSKKLEMLLNELGVKYKILGDDIIMARMISFCVDKNTATESQLLRVTHSKPIITKEFSKRELERASYLTLFPTKLSIEILNTDTAYQFRCRRKTVFGEIRFEHREQIEPLIVGNDSFATSVTFYTATTGFSELFAHRRFYELVKENQLTGIDFWPVFCIRNHNTIQSELYQVFAEEVIPFDSIMINDQSEIKKCSICGQKKIVYKQEEQLVLKGSREGLTKDFYMTESVFGEGLSFPMYIISHNLYELICSADMKKNVKLMPVVFEKA